MLRLVYVQRCADSYCGVTRRTGSPRADAGSGVGVHQSGLYDEFCDRRLRASANLQRTGTGGDMHLLEVESPPAPLKNKHSHATWRPNTESKRPDKLRAVLLFWLFDL